MGHGALSAPPHLPSVPKLLRYSTFQRLSEYGFAYSLKRKRVSFQRVLVSPMEKERKHTFVRVQVEYGFDSFQVRFGLVVSTISIGSAYGFGILLDQSASESHMQHSTQTAP